MTISLLFARVKRSLEIFCINFRLEREIFCNVYFSVNLIEQYNDIGLVE